MLCYTLLYSLFIITFAVYFKFFCAVNKILKTVYKHFFSFSSLQWHTDIIKDVPGYINMLISTILDSL